MAGVRVGVFLADSLVVGSLVGCCYHPLAWLGNFDRASGEKKVLHELLILLGFL